MKKLVLSLIVIFCVAISFNYAADVLSKTSSTEVANFGDGDGDDKKCCKKKKKKKCCKKGEEKACCKKDGEKKECTKKED